MEDIIIIGAGPVGIYAAYLASLHNLKGVVIEGMDNPGGQLTALYPEKDIIDLPGFAKIAAKDFIALLIKQQQGHANALPIHLGERVENFEKINDGYQIKTNQNTYHTRTLLIASGMGLFSPRKTGLVNEDQFNNIIYSIKEKSQYNDKIIAILGGGDSAVDWALTLKDIAKEVYIIHRREEFRAQSSSVSLMEQKGVKIIKPYLLKSFIGQDSVKTIEVEHATTKDTLSIDVDVVFVNYGLMGNPSLFPIETERNAFIVNRYFMTSLENVFAIGNAITYEGKVKNITAGFGEAVIAIGKIDQIINPNKNIPVHF